MKSTIELKKTCGSKPNINHYLMNMFFSIQQRKRKLDKQQRSRLESFTTTSSVRREGIRLGGCGTASLQSRVHKIKPKIEDARHERNSTMHFLRIGNRGLDHAVEDPRRARVLISWILIKMISIKRAEKSIIYS
jgi:hypothetical protein